MEMEMGTDEAIIDLCSGNFILDHVGDVILNLDSHRDRGLSWKLVDPSRSRNQDRNICFGIKLGGGTAAGGVAAASSHVKFSDIYAVEFIDQALPHRSTRRQLHRFIVHAVQRSNSHPSLWTTSMFIFAHKDPRTCQLWVDRITDALSKQMEDRPMALLIFVHPMSGKGNGCRTWETVAPIFSRASVQTKVIVTERAGHAFDVMRTLTDEELKQYDGVLAVGGDGFFNEILNGFLSTRHRASYPPAPEDFVQSVGGHSDCSVDVAYTSHDEDESPLIPGNGLGISPLAEGDSSDTGVGSELVLPNERFRFGIIPAGSTDAIVICTTGARDPITSALHIVLGKRVGLDIGQIVRWKMTSTSKVEPCVRYAASFAGYGFYGDVITESEKYRWMGPKRYDYAGTKVFVKHRVYEAEVACLKVHTEGTIPLEGQKKSQKVICRVNCEICNGQTAGDWIPGERESNWSRSKGRYLSVGGAIMANRNERAPDGLVADAHLGDGFLHLILIKDCPRALYLMHLLQLAKKDGNPLNYDFVEHHKTRAFTFKSLGNSSIWNLDGEPFCAHQLSAQVFQRLVSLFASGPPV